MAVTESRAFTQLDIDAGTTTSQTAAWYWGPVLTLYLNGTVEGQGNTIFWNPALRDLMIFAGLDPDVIPPEPQPPTPPTPPVGPTHPTSGQGWPLW